MCVEVKPEPAKPRFLGRAELSPVRQSTREDLSTFSGAFEPICLGVPLTRDGAISTEVQYMGKRSSLVDTSVIYCGDCLDKLQELPTESVDLIYIDPPFNSNRQFETFWPEVQEKRRFEDRHASTQAYLDFMRPRCVELRRVLKKTGSLYYHCDWHASHYIKAVLLDQLFGESQFQNEIIWRRTTAHGDTHGFGHVHDTIFRYSNGGKPIFNVQTRPHSQAYLDNFLFTRILTLVNAAHISWIT
jgi:hypothetical protein